MWKSANSLRGEVCSKLAAAEFTRICHRLTHSLVNPGETIAILKKSVTSSRNGSQRAEMKYELAELGSTQKTGEQLRGNLESISVGFNYSSGVLQFPVPWEMTLR